MWLAILCLISNLIENLACLIKILNKFFRPVLFQPEAKFKCNCAYVTLPFIADGWGDPRPLGCL